MNEQDLLVSNLIEVAKAQTLLAGIKNYLDKLYAKIEVDDMSKKDQLFSPLYLFYQSTVEAVDLIKSNTDNLIIIHQGQNPDLN